MLYASDFSDEEGLSDDPDYYDFKRRLKANRRKALEKADLEADPAKQQAQAVFSAITYERKNEFFEELDKGFDVNTEFECGWTPLLLASSIANVEIVTRLLESGADINKTIDCHTPLMLACNNSKNIETRIASCTQLLLKHGVNVNAFDKKRRTAIMMAANNGHARTVELLLPLVDRDAEDNQRWDVLFWAVSGNHPMIVSFLLSQGFTCDKVDIRGNTVADLAQSNSSDAILKLLPKDPMDNFYLALNTSSTFEDTFGSLKNGEKPRFTSDICKILYGTKSESVLATLWEKNVDLSELLATSDTKLIQLGVRFPFQRRRILLGLYKLHKHPFHPKSIPFASQSRLYTNLDVSAEVLTCVKQLIAMEAGLRFILANYNDPKRPESSQVRVLLSKNRQQIRRLRGVTEQLVKKSEQWDLMVKPVDRVTLKRRNVPWANLYLSVSLITLLTVFAYKKFL